MTLYCKAVAFNTGTGVTPIPVSLGWLAVCGWVSMNGQTGAPDPDDVSSSTSVATHASEGFFTASAAHASGFTDVAAVSRSNGVTDGCLIEVAALDGSVVGKLQVSIGATSVTFTPASAFSQNYRVEAFIVGGDIQAEIANVVEPSEGGGAGTSTIEDVAFEPNAATTLLRAVVDVRPQFGMGFAGQDLDAVLVNGYSGACAQADTARHWARTGQAFGVLGGGNAIAGRGHFTEWTADGAEIVWDEADGHGTFSVLLLRVGGDGVALVQNNTFNDIVSTNVFEPEFTPKGGIIISCRTPEVAADNSGSEARWIRGCWDADENMHAFAMVRSEGAVPTVLMSMTDAAFYIGEDGDGAMALAEPPEDTVTTIMDTDDWTACWQQMLLFGSVASTGIAPQRAMVGVGR